MNDQKFFWGGGGGGGRWGDGGGWVGCVQSFLLFPGHKAHEKRSAVGLCQQESEKNIKKQKTRWRIAVHQYDLPAGGGDQIALKPGQQH